MRNLLLSSIFAVIAGAVLLSPVKAHASQLVTVADFPACANPQGSLIANYASGIHGIPGNPATYSGSDKVYQLDPQKVMQCYCNTGGAGIQTDWLKTAGMSQDQIDSYTQAGWIIVPDGQNWGLDQGTYLAKNNDFSCNGSNNGSSNQGDGLSDGKSDGKSDGHSSGPSNQSVLGLASTGNAKDLAIFFSFGLGFTLIGFYLLKSSK